MTICHEFGHALDCALGDGVYRSSTDATLRKNFYEARDYVTPYAATGTDEFFAECVRSFVEANDPSSHWPKATKERLQKCDPAMLDYIEAIFDDLAKGAA